MKHTNNNKESISKRLATILSLSLSLAAMIFFSCFLSASAHGGGGGGMITGAGFSMGGMSSMGYGLMGAGYGVGGLGLPMSGYSPAGYNFGGYNLGTSLMGNMMGGMMGNMIGGMMNYGYGYGMAGYNPWYNTVTTPIVSTTPTVPATTTNTAAMFGGWGSGYGPGYGGWGIASVMPVWGQNNMFGNTYGNMLGMTPLSQPAAGSSAMNYYGNYGLNSYGMGSSGMGGQEAEIYRHDQGHMVSMGHVMGWGINQPTVTAVETTPTSPSLQPTNYVSTGTNPMPYANAITDTGVAGFMSGLGTQAPTFLPYGPMNQYGFTYGNPW
ncbi:MAG: hypothetical protein K6U11_05930 [bacterium]|nr:hypothetical protein [bacterium]